MRVGVRNMEMKGSGMVTRRELGNTCHPYSEGGKRAGALAMDHPGIARLSEPRFGQRGLSLRHTIRPIHGQRVEMHRVVCGSTASFHDDIMLQAYVDGRKEAVQAADQMPHMPPTPKSATLASVIPYLGKLALQDGNLHWRVGAAMVALLVSKSAGLLAPICFKSAVDMLTSGGTSTVIGAPGILGRVMPTVTMALVLNGLCRAVNALAKEAQHPLFTPVSQAAGRKVSFQALFHVLNLDLYFHLGRNTGALARMLERGAKSISMIFRAVLFTLVPTALELVAVCYLLARSFELQVWSLVIATFVVYFVWTVALTWVRSCSSVLFVAHCDCISEWSMMFLITLYVFLYLLDTQASTKIRREVKNLDNVIGGRAVDALLNVEAVKLSAAEKYEVEAYDQKLQKYQRASVMLEVASAVLNAGQGIILAVGMTAALIAASMDPMITPGDLVMIQGLLLQLWAPLQFLGWFYRELRQSLVDMEDLFILMKTQTKIPEGNVHLGFHQSTSLSKGVQVELENVEFKYPGTKRRVLKGVNIRAEPGQSIAVVGPSGSGKSTLLRLLVRLFDVDKGVVKLDSLDVKTLTSASLRDALAVVPQDTVLFNDTILHNISYGEPNATIEDTVEAVKAAKLMPAIERMPDRWNTEVGERGLKLSGGEKQRVAIARAFLRKPRLLICDEATSALDTATEKGIMASLQELATGRTSVFVAHRLSTIQGCDKIYVLKDGVVAEEGTHSQLMALDGIYKEMWLMQVAEAALEEDSSEDSASSSDDESYTNGHSPSQLIEEVRNHSY